MAASNNNKLVLFVALNLVLCNLAFSHYVSPVQLPAVETCPPDTLKLKVCADVLDLVHVRVGSLRRTACCNLIGNLVKADAAACLCTAVHLDILDLVKLDLKIDLTLLVNQCGYNLPTAYKCPPRLN